MLQTVVIWILPVAPLIRSMVASFNTHFLNEFIVKSGLEFQVEIFINFLQVMLNFHESTRIIGLPEYLMSEITIIAKPAHSRSQILPTLSFDIFNPGMPFFLTSSGDEAKLNMYLRFCGFSCKIMVQVLTTKELRQFLAKFQLLGRPK